MNPTTPTRLRALADHIERHNLGDTIIAATVSKLGVESMDVHAYERGNLATCLLRWADTITDVAINAERWREGTVHMHLKGTVEGSDHSDDHRRRVEP